jgi:hypothetical protein
MTSLLTLFVTVFTIVMFTLVWIGYNPVLGFVIVWLVSFYLIRRHRPDGGKGPKDEAGPSCSSQDRDVQVHGGNESGQQGPGAQDGARDRVERRVDQRGVQE